MSRPQGLRVLLAGGTSGDELVKVLQTAGHEVVACSDAVAALTVARSYWHDVVVLDLDELRGGDPFALVLAIRADSRWHKPMFVALTDGKTGGCHHCEQCCREAGIDLLLLKPVHPEAIAGFLGRLWKIVEDYDSFDPVI